MQRSSPLELVPERLSGDVAVDTPPSWAPPDHGREAGITRRTDGTAQGGPSTLDVSAITGESVPVKCAPGHPESPGP